MPDFLLYALIGGLLATLMTTPMGTLLLWRRMAYFGDTLAHTTLLGLGIGLWLSIDFSLALVLTTSLLALGAMLLHQRHDLSADTLLAVLAHSSLGLGMLALALLPGARVDLMGYLFGDLLSLMPQDLALLALASLIVLLSLRLSWRAQLLSILNPDLARLEGINPARSQLQFALLLALVVALSVKLVGALLMTALLITPAAIARRWAHGPLDMLLKAILVGQTGVLLGLGWAWWQNLPASPAIVGVLFAAFVLSRLLPASTPAH